MKNFPFYHWLIALLILFINVNMFAQQSEKDKLRMQISKETNDTIKIKLMVRFVMVFGQFEGYEKWYSEIHELSKKTNFRQGLIYNRFYEGLLLADENRYDEAIAKVKNCIDGLDSLRIVQPFAYPLYYIRYLFWQAGKQLEMFQYYSDKVVYYRKHGPIENTADCYHGIGRYYQSLADYDKAIGYFFRALNVYKTFDLQGEMNEKLNIGGLYFEWGNFDKAEEYQKSNLKDLIRLNEVANTDVYDALGNICFERHDYKQALFYYFKGKQCYTGSLLRAKNFLNIAAVHLQLEANDSVLYYLEGAEKISKKENPGILFNYNFTDIDFYFYKYFAATGKRKLALQHLQTALQQAQLSKNIPLLIKYTNEFYSYLLKHGDSLQSLRYLVQYHAIQDSLNKMNTQARIASFEIEQQQQLKEHEIEQLKVQKTSQRNYYLIGGAFLLLIVMAVVSRIFYKRKRDKEQLTTDFKKQLAQAETKALRAQMNPHFIFNSLNSINSFVMDQKHEIASDYLIKFSKLIRLILDNSRSETISIEKELETLKLYVILEAARFDNRFKCVYVVAEDVDTNSIRIPPMLLQPFVENAIWHGLMQKEGEGTITIDISMINEQITENREQLLRITITDDGIGREKASELKSKSATHKSHGLKVTSQRIEMMNKLNSTGAQVNVIDLKDEQGNATGTKVELIIPF
jgi:tetratricopeptide (TPR) repeat protein